MYSPELVPIEVARELERELAAVTDERDVLRHQLNIATTQDLTLGDVASAIQDRDTLKARVAKLEKDAARYRWLRDDQSAALWYERNWCLHETDKQFDAAIDAAMQERAK